MSQAPAPAPRPSLAEVEEIAAMRSAMLRNLRITECYYRLSAAFVARTGPCANWCTYATWASRQAGRTIRGEDLLDCLKRQSRVPARLLRPVESLWRVLLRRGLLDSETRLGRLVAAIHSPFDAFERASEAVARGNLKVFAEIGREFARCLAGGPMGGLPQELLRQAFDLYERQEGESDPCRRAQMILLANLLIGLHEQTRLQPEIRAAMDAPAATAEDLGARALAALFPASRQWPAPVRRPAAALLEPAARGFWRFSRALTRRVITDCLMTISVAGQVLPLGSHLGAPIPEVLSHLDYPELLALLARFEPASPARDDCAARDWSDLTQRMHYISHLFVAYHERLELCEPPFRSEQVRDVLAGRLPAGDL